MRTVLLSAGLGVASLAGVAMAMAPDVASFGVGAASFGGTTTVTDLPAYGERGSDVVSYRHGATVEISVPLRNTSRLPVTVTSADLGGQRLPLLTITGGSSLQLGPGDVGTLRLTGVLGNCRYYHEREVSTYDAVRIGYEVLGRSGQREVQLARPLLVHSPMIIGCPDRKLNRQAYNRTG